MGLIFIAYSSKDMRPVIKLREELRRRTTHKIFVAHMDIPIGELWRDEINNNLTAADFFICLISRNFLGSREALRELQFAISTADEKKIRVIPVLIEDLKEKGLPYYLRDRQFIPYKPFEEQVNDIIRHLLPQDIFTDVENFSDYINSLLDLIHRPGINPKEILEQIRDLAKRTFSEVRVQSASDWGKIIKDVADKLWLQGYRQEAIELYNILINRFPVVASIRLSRSQKLLALGDYQQADEDCVTVLKREPKNARMLIQRIWVRKEWATVTPNNQKMHCEIIRECLTKLAETPAVYSTYLPGYLHVLSIGADLCKDFSYAEKAVELLEKNKDNLKQTEKKEDRKAILKSLKNLEKIYYEVGKIDEARKLITLREKFEDLWRMYSY